MEDGFAQMVEAARGFFAELRNNNSKDWFTPRKAAYEAEIRKPAELFAEIMAQDLGQLTGQNLRPKVFRIYRDVRFSKDKTPFNTHLHLMWSDTSGAAMAPTWYFGLSPDYFILGTGFMALDKDNLAKFRAHVDQQGDALIHALTSSGAEISDWGPDPLKRVPKPFAPDHRHADILKRKAFAVHKDVDANWNDNGLRSAALATAKSLLPVARAMTPP